jgi:DNA primase
LDIPEQIIIAEVNKFRVNNRKQKDREERRSQQEDKSVISQGPPSGFEYQPDHKQSNTHEFVDSKNYQEEELLKTLILHADKEFSEDLTVAEFIFNEFEEEQIWPISEDFRQIFRDAHTHLKEHKVLNELYFIRNAASSKIAAEVLSVRHNLSKGWENNYEKFVKSDQENYKSQVIDNLNYLKLKHIDLLMKENQEKLKIAETEEDIMILQQVHDNLLKIRQKITDQSGTVIS